MNFIAEAIPLLLNAETVACMLLGNLVGILFGAIPGFTGVMAIAIILPFTFSLSPTSGIVMLFSCFCGGCFGGSISAILIGTPGAPEAAATVKDGYKLAKKGEAYRAISMAAFASCTAGLVSSLLLIVLAPIIAEWTLLFAPPEYFVLGIFGISVIAGLNEGNMLVGLCAGCLGILLSTVGMDAQSGVTRFAFGNMGLYSGLNLTAIILGVFALNRIFSGFASKADAPANAPAELVKSRLTAKDYRDCAGPILRGTVIGSIIGAIPAAGAAIAAFIAYNVEKVFCRRRKELGTGILEGVAAPEAANNAVTGTSLIPLLTLGIPGSGGAAALLGAFMMHGLAPGPFLFRNNGATIYAILIGFMLTNVMLFLVIKALERGFVRVTSVPEIALISVLFVICLAGAYCSNSSWQDILLTVTIGIAAYFMSRLNIPLIPLILGFILGPTIEVNYRKAIIMSEGDGSIFFTRPICIALIVLTVLMLAGTMVMNRSLKNGSEQAK